LALVVVSAASFLGCLDFFIVNVSIPAIQADLHARFGEIQLMIAGYGLTYAVCLITGGRLGDIYGRKRMFLLGMGGFTLASGLCGLATCPEMLIAARVLQGITGAVMFPQVLSIIQVSFPADERHIAFGIFGMIVGTGSFSGNVLGGLLVQGNLFGLGWRPIFLVNLPLGIIALAAAVRLVHESHSERAKRLDLGGVAIVSLGLLLLVYPLVMGREEGWPAWTFACLVLSVPVLILFAYYERRVSAGGGAPLVELGLFHNRVFTAGLITSVVYYGGLSAFFLAVTVYFQDGLGMTPLEAGLTFAPFAVGFLIASNRAIHLTPRLGSRVIQLGVTLMALGLSVIVALASLLGAGVPVGALVAALLVYGTGQGFVMPTLLSTVLSGIPHHEAGSASGVLSTVQQVALAMGVAVIGSIYFGILGSYPPGQGFDEAISVSLLFNIGLLASTFGLVFLLPRRLVGEFEGLAAEI
jgi:EmrB/QacA subfamily drug resistance transporter